MLFRSPVVAPLLLAAFKDILLKALIAKGTSYASKKLREKLEEKGELLKLYNKCRSLGLSMCSSSGSSGEPGPIIEFGVPVTTFAIVVTITSIATFLFLVLCFGVCCCPRQLNAYCSILESFFCFLCRSKPRVDMPTLPDHKQPFSAPTLLALQAQDLAMPYSMPPYKERRFSTYDARFPDIDVPRHESVQARPTASVAEEPTFKFHIT